MASINLDPLVNAASSTASNANVHTWLGVAVMVLTMLYTQGDTHRVPDAPATPPPAIVVTTPPATPPPVAPPVVTVTPEERKLLDVLKLPAYAELRKQLLDIK